LVRGGIGCVAISLPFAAGPGWWADGFLVSNLSSIGGFDYAGPIFNGASDCVEDSRQLRSDYFPKADELVLMATRPALNDPRKGKDNHRAHWGRSRNLFSAPNGK
jgi:hypothetical protein